MKQATSHPLLLALMVLAALGVPGAPAARGATLVDAPEAGAPEPPRTPQGLAACGQPIVAEAGPGQPGERLEYDVRVFGLGVGKLDMEAARRGRFRGEPVTEYVGQLRATGVVSAFVTLEGAAAALVPDDVWTPVQASHRYRWQSDSESELQTFDDGGRAVESKRRVKSSEKTDVRRFNAPVQDLLSGLYLLRRLPGEAGGCAIIAASGKAYTVWLEPEGRERLHTALGDREAIRYHLRYGGDDEKQVKDARVWVGTDALHLMYKAEGLNRYHPVIELAGYRPGVDPSRT